MGLTSVMGVSLFSADTMALTSLIQQLRAARLRPLSMDCKREGVGGGEREERGGEEGDRYICV